MAWTEFYMQTTGSNLNAGSTNADSAAATSTNGDWGNAAANRFTAASGTPFSGTSVGDWASVYLDAATSAVYVAKVTAVNGGGASIDLSTTDKIGTAPTTSATGRSCKVGGAWASFAAINSLMTTGTVNSSTRVNVKAGTYANTTTTITITTAGATTGPLWFRGYLSSIGDLDGNVSHGTFADGSTCPAITFTTGRLVPSGNFQIYSNLDIQGAQTTNGQLRSSTISNVRFIRCRIECTAANANGSACSLDCTNLVMERCWMKATSTATAVYTGAPASATFVGCVVTGGGHGISLTSTTTAVIYHCSFVSCGGDSIRINSAGRLWVLGCTSYNAGSDAIETLTSLPTVMAYYDNIYANSAGYGENNSTGTNTAIVARGNNLTYSNTSGTDTGYGDAPATCVQTDSASPFVNAAGGDFSLVENSNARANGLPGAFENQSYTSYLDIGAVQRQEPPNPRSLIRTNIGTH